MNNSFKISLLVLLILISRFVLQVDYNEMDVLPSAYSVFNSNWLPGDWYLSLRIPYRELFGYIIGFFIDWAGFIPVMILGRLVTYVLFAYAYFLLLETVKINFFIGCIVLMTYLSWFSDGAFYGEWMVGGLETKVFSYVFVLFSLSSFINKFISKGLLFAGLALSFHLLIGGYFSICLLIVFLTQRRSELLYTFQSFYWYLLGGIWGIYGIYEYLMNTGNLDFGWKIYAQLRLAYHVLPKFSFSAISVLLLMILFNITILKYSKREYLKTLSIVALVASVISIVGYLVYFIGETSMLRFYFFRLNDAFAPLLSLLILSAYLSKEKKFDGNKHLVKLTSVTFLVCFIGFVLLHWDNVKVIVNPSNYAQEIVLERSAIDFEMTSWIKDNTSKESAFIVPMNMSNFYIEAERSMFVSWKHLPQSSAEIEEWYSRLMLLNKGENLERTLSFYPAKLESNYSNLSEKELSRIKERYPELTHIILPIDSNLELSEVFKSDKHKLYRLELNIPPLDQKQGKPKPN